MPVVNYIPPASLTAQLIHWDGSDTAKRELREVFGDAVAFVEIPTRQGVDTAIVCSVEDDGAARYVESEVEEEDGTRTLVRTLVRPECDPAIRRQVVKFGEYVHVSDAPGPMTREQVLANFPGIDLG